MQEPTLRQWHRYVGIIVGAFIMLQAASGLFLSIEWMLGFHHKVGAIIETADIPQVLVFWDWLFVNVHYGGGKIGAIYHTAVGAGLLWLAASGFAIHHRVRQRLKRHGKKNATRSSSGTF